MSMKTPQNVKWVKAYKAWCKKQGIADKQCVTDDPMMHAYMHVKLWAKAVEKAGIDRCRQSAESAGRLGDRQPGGQIQGG